VRGACATAAAALVRPQGLVHEFYPPEGAAAGAQQQEPWQLTLINGLWSLLLALGLLLSCLQVLQARR
jgi:hypothetical protein